MLKVYTLNGIVRYLSHVFLNKNFHLLGYLCGTLRYTLLFEHLVLSAKSLPKDYKILRIKSMKRFWSVLCGQKPMFGLQCRVCNAI